MNKYWSIFKISFEQEFVYRLNFIMWRVRNVLQIFLIFFLWDTVFSDPNRAVFGYDRAKILTYIFALLVVRALVTSSRSYDVAGEISQGLLANYLIKPFSYFKYWFTRDVSSKALNIIFAIFEVGFLFLLLRPPFFLQTNIAFLLLSVSLLVLAIILFFLLMFIFNLFPLWYPEQAWGPTFILLIFVDFLGGGVFPIDILPASFQKILYLTPFPYLLFVPIQTYLGRLDMITAIRSLVIAAFWATLLAYILRKVWNVGLKVYRSEGR